MDLSAILARLKAQLTGLKSVGNSADLDAAFDSVVAVPAAFVLPLAESATETDDLGETGERNTHVFGVVHVVSNARDASGAASLDKLVTPRSNLRAALVGWVPNEENGEPVHFRAGRLLKLDGNGRLWWIDEFAFDSFSFF